MKQRSIYDFNYIISVIKAIVENRRKRKQHQHLLRDFFDFNKPCRPDIKNCEKLRQEFARDLQLAQKDGRCPRCILAILHNSYIRRLLDAQQ